jgi:hypothetical protein
LLHHQAKAARPENILRWSCTPLRDLAAIGNGKSVIDVPEV